MALLSITLLLSITALHATVTQVERKAYENGNTKLGLSFVDISGKLTELIEFKAEILAKSTYWLEGPVWITDTTNDKGGYLLFTEPFTANTIWSYDPSTNKFEKKYVIPNCCPGALAWTKTFPDELNIACFVSERIIKMNLTNWEYISHIDLSGQASYSNISSQPADIVIDKNGNIYFSELPFTRLNQNIGDNSIDIKGGIYFIERETTNIELITQTEYGPNGISISTDYSFMVAANFFDVPINEWDSQNYEQHDWSKLFVNGYK
eukprot:197777_1